MGVSAHPVESLSPLARAQGGVEVGVSWLQYTVFLAGAIDHIVRPDLLLCNNLSFLLARFNMGTINLPPGVLSSDILSWGNSAVVAQLTDNTVIKCPFGGEDSRTQIEVEKH